MTALIISDNGDGTATVAPIDATPEMLQEGEQFASMDEAVQAAGEVLGEASAGPEDHEATDPDNTEQIQAPGGEAPLPPQGASTGEDEEEDILMGGYKSAKAGH